LISPEGFSFDVPGKGEYPAIDLFIAMTNNAGETTTETEVALKLCELCGVDPLSLGYVSDGAAGSADEAWDPWRETPAPRLDLTLLPEVVAKARAEGHPVLIDFTAKWCLTCRVNKSNSIEVDAVKEKLKEMNAKAFLADYSLRDPKIGAGIRSYGRAAVPLVVVLPADPSAAPILLPEGFFTESTMLQALDVAAGAKPQMQASK